MNLFTGIEHRPRFLAIDLESRHCRDWDHAQAVYADWPDQAAVFAAQVMDAQEPICVQNRMVHIKSQNGAIEVFYVSVDMRPTYTVKPLSEVERE